MNNKILSALFSWMLALASSVSPTQNPVRIPGPGGQTTAVAGNPFTLIFHGGVDTGGTSTTFVHSFAVPGNMAGMTLCVAPGWLDTSINVSGVADTAGNATYTQVANARANSTAGGFASDVWCVPQSAGSASPVQITVTFSGTTGAYRAMGFWAFQRTGSPTPAIDVGNNASNATGSGTDINGASVTTTSSAGFAVAIVIVNSGPVTGNPKSGNEFTAGGDLLTVGGNAVASVITTTTGAHQPVWTDTTSSDIYCASTAAIK